MSQTSYSRSFAGAFSGMLSDQNPQRIETLINDEGSNIPAGVGVVIKSEGKAELADSLTKDLLGIVVHSMARDPDDLSGEDAVKDGKTMNVLTEGSIFVKVEETVAVTDPVYVRVVSDGADNTQLGRFRTDADTDGTDRAKLVKGARWIRGASAGGVAELFFSAAADHS